MAEMDHTGEQETEAWRTAQPGPGVEKGTVDTCDAEGQVPINSAPAHPTWANRVATSVPGCPSTSV